MLRPVPLILILAVMLTSIGLGAARGTVRMGEQIVLCTGHGIVVTHLPDDQGTRVHLCPDMALSLMAGVAPDMVGLPQRFGAPRALAMGAGIASVSRGPDQVRARDPPVVMRA